MGLKLYIAGQEVTPPKEWQGLKILAAFGTNSNQPEIESDRLTLVKDAAKLVIDDVAAGNIFEGLDAKLEYTQRNNTIAIFDGFIDTSEDYEELDPTFGGTDRPNQVNVKFRGKDTIKNFQDQIEGVTYGYLYDQGDIQNTDFVNIPTVIVKKSNFTDVAVAVVMTYILIKQLQDTISEIADATAKLIAIAASGLPGPIAAAAYSIAIILIRIAYAIALLSIIVSTVSSLVALLIPPVVKNKGMKYRKLLTKACAKYGYTFVSPIKELDIYHYLPSKPFSDSANIVAGIIPKNVPTKLGIPSPSDFGYLLTEMFELCKRMFNAKVDVIGNEVHLRNVNDPYWYNISTYVPPISIRFPKKKFNTQDLKQTRIMSFQVDQNDEWTIENYTGTSFEVKTEPTSTVNIKNVVIKGLDRIDIPVALPNAKTKLNNIEFAISQVATAADLLMSLLGQSSNLASTIQYNRVNVLKISQNDYSVAKVVPLVNGQLLPYHRAIVSAKVLYQKYHQSKSFVTGGRLGQKVIYEGVKLPFTLADFITTLHNGSFVLPDGRKARFITLPYQFSSDTVEADIEVQEVYTTKLKEIYYEP